MAPFKSPKRTQGALPLDPAHWQFLSRRTARAAQCGCGVHGFAMNPCESLPFSTAPYYREARVTVVRRQTACGMRLCCARRIDECLGRRILVCTPTRSAERHPHGVCRIRKAAEPPTAAQQRIIGAEANRLTTPNAATPRYGKCSRQALQLFELLARNIKAFLLGFQRGYSLLRKRISPLIRAAPLALLSPPPPCTVQGQKQRCRAASPSHPCENMALCTISFASTACAPP